MTSYRVTYPDRTEVVVTAEHELGAVQIARFLRGELDRPDIALTAPTFRDRGPTDVYIHEIDAYYTVDKLP